MLPWIEFRPASDIRIFEHPARTRTSSGRARKLGRLFEFHPSFVEQGRAAVLDFDLRRMQELDARQVKKYTPISDSHPAPSTSP
jgi:hypothetical protein